MNAASKAFFDFAKDKALLRPSDAVALGRSRLYLAQLAKRGRLHKVSRGLYALPQRTASEFATLAESVQISCSQRTPSRSQCCACMQIPA